MTSMTNAERLKRRRDGMAKLREKRAADELCSRCGDLAKLRRDGTPMKGCEPCLRRDRERHPTKKRGTR